MITAGVAEDEALGDAVFGDQAVDRSPIPRTLLLRRGSHRDPAVAGSEFSVEFLGETSVSEPVSEPRVPPIGLGSDG
jgi:hypothetical protein